MERHPELSLCKGDAFALSRAAAITDNSMRQYYSLLKATLEECSILDCPSQIYNMNESGPSLLNKLIYGEFEQQKIIFGDEDNDDNRIPAVVNIPTSFMKFYNPAKLEAAINFLCKGAADLDGNELTIEPFKMREFFEDAIKHICRYAFLALERV